MNRPLSIGVVAVCIAMSAVNLASESRAAQSKKNGDRFIGAWRLVWLEEPGPDGNVHKADCTGLLVYTPDGHMSVQVMYRNPPAATSDAPVQYAQGGYEAS